MAKLVLSEGANWAIERLPNDIFEQLKENIEAWVTTEMEFGGGYTADVKKSFNESGPVKLERKP